MISPLETTLTLEQLSHIKMNLELSIDERIDQLQNAVNLIEEMKSSLTTSDFKLLISKLEDPIKAKLALKRPKDLEVAKELEIIKNELKNKS